mmetsp:Transcript_18493/g.70123  ORF Transcript_18493/g.70123 Transcript_18493/m.70123 type:complete len:255 (+) Transcript_18493:800-1564(+)
MPWVPQIAPSGQKGDVAAIHSATSPESAPSSDRHNSSSASRDTTLPGMKGNSELIDRGVQPAMACESVPEASGMVWQSASLLPSSWPAPGSYLIATPTSPPLNEMPSVPLSTGKNWPGLDIAGIVNCPAQANLQVGRVAATSTTSGSEQLEDERDGHATTLRSRPCTSSLLPPPPSNSRRTVAHARDSAAAKVAATAGAAIWEDRGPGVECLGATSERGSSMCCSQAAAAADDSGVTSDKKFISSDCEGFLQAA